MKKAMLVTLSITTRVTKEYIIADNVENVCYDDGCPYGSMPNDEKECF